MESVYTCLDHASQCRYSRAGGMPEVWLRTKPTEVVQVSAAFIVVIVFMAVVMLISLSRLRSGGPGPGVNWVPRSMRGKLNRAYEKRGWQKPYDADGNRNPDRGQL